MRVLGDIIARTLPYMQLPTGTPTRTRFFWFTSDVFLKRPISSKWDSSVLFLQGSSLAKAVSERTTFCAWGVLQRESSIVSSRCSALMCHLEHKPQEPQRSSWLQEKDAEQPALTNARHTHCASRQLGTTKTCQCDHASLWRWRPWCRPLYGEASHCKGILSKDALLHLAKHEEPTGTGSSANSAWEIIQKLS